MAVPRDRVSWSTCTDRPTELSTTVTLSNFVRFSSTENWNKAYECGFPVMCKVIASPPWKVLKAVVNKGAIKVRNAQIDQLISNAHISKLCGRTLPHFSHAPAHFRIIWLLQKFQNGTSSIQKFFSCLFCRDFNQYLHLCVHFNVTITLILLNLVPQNWRSFQISHVFYTIKLVKEYVTTENEMHQKLHN